MVNRTLESYLRCFIQGKPRQWAQWLHWAEYCYNSASHTSINMSPFQALYGRSPPLIRYAQHSTQVDTLDNLLLFRDAIWDELKFNLIRAQQRMKKMTDVHHRDLEFAVGDQVFLKLQPYRQQSLAKRHCHKLAACFYGAFSVVGKIGAVAHKLDLPHSCKSHLVFHVSQLKPARGSQLTPALLPPQLSADMELQAVPDALLNVKFADPGTHLVDQLLIKWKDLPASDATWEFYDNMAAYFPSFHLEDKVKVWAVGNFTTQVCPPIRFTYSRAKGRNV